MPILLTRENHVIIKEKGFNLVKQYRKIPSTKFLYEISRDGSLRNVKSKKIVRGSVGKEKNNEYVHVWVKYGGILHHKRVHQFVMECWGAKKPGDGYIIDHIDGNKTNNDISNLRWATREENVKNSDYYRSGERSRKIETYKFPKKPVMVEDRWFPSRWAACKYIKAQSGCQCSIKNLSDKMYLRRKNIFGFKIKYL